MDPLLRTALRAADAAADVHRRHSGRVDVAGAAEKGYADFVSRVDLEAQEAALEVIQDEHPEHRILAEEEGEDGKRSGPAGDGTILGPDDPDAPLWVVDPLDGTTNFLNGHPMYSASIAVFVDGRPRAGAVHCAPTGDRWWAARGQGARKNGQPIRVSELRDLAPALVGTGFPFKVLEMLPDYQRQFARVLQSTSGIRRGGSAALDLCYVADGTFDAFWELYLKPWDFAAGLILVEEAGGVVRRVDGSDVSLEEGSVVAANSPRMLDALLALLRDADADGPDDGDGPA